MMKPSMRARVHHVLSDFAVDNIRRRAQKRLVNEMERLRPGSFPFISADTFRALSDAVVENEEITFRRQLHPRSIIYFDLASLKGNESGWRSSKSLSLLADAIEVQSRKPIVIMHNGDWLPQKDVLEKLQSEAFHVFSSNVLEETPQLTALPVGLENAYRNANGTLEDFLKARDSQIASERDIRIFSRFKIQNNPEIRRPLAERLAVSRFGWDDQRLGPHEYRSLVLSSKFVLSPPGNGIDCHRTWEAIYLGAVPVTLSDFSPHGLFSGMPVLVIDSFEEILVMSDSEIDQLFDQVVNFNIEKCYMPYWVSRIRDMAHSD